jgi:mannose-1-phosphate guanylyltransferase/mannose-6-phosphate isomerase
MSVPLVPVILCGGSGTRLWPMSRRQYPKQFLPLVSALSMLQDTALRASALKGAQPAVILAGEEHRFLVAEQMREAGIALNAIVLEPFPRNTAPALAVAALAIQQIEPDAVMLVLPADHLILNENAFQSAVQVAIKAAMDGALTAFGITPDRPETGYGYIEQGEQISDGCYRIRRFVEKPDTEMAVSLVSAGLLWNSGMFVMKATRYLDELATLRPDILATVRTAWDKRSSDRDFCRLDAKSFAACPAESIDYAVMERTAHAAVVPADMGWSDVGSWTTLWETSSKDRQGNAVWGDVDVQDTRNSYLRSENRLLSVTGMDDVVVVVTADAVLVTRRDLAQSVKDVVSRLDGDKRSEHLNHRRVYRPWGYFESIDAGAGFQVKRLMVKPGEALSLQLHNQRAEHWVVVSGTARVTCGDAILTLERNQSTYIPVGTRHRLENPAGEPLYLIEVQSGDYLGEDDIVRFEDRYSRN